ncbi:unnamed protein product, partial [Polarella glacialis]
LLRRVLQERGRGVGGQVQRSEVVASGGKRACTEILSVVHKAGPQGEPVSIVEVRLHTGRLHQIRAHLASEGHPLVGDPSYGGSTPHWCPRTFLHAARLALPALDASEDASVVDVPLPEDLAGALSALSDLPEREQNEQQQQQQQQ